jgi:zinc transporter ZupT
VIVESACDLFAAHEIPQELGDFGILIHAGWSRHAALACDLASSSTVILGGLLAHGLAGHADVTVFSSPSPSVRKMPGLGP